MLPQELTGHKNKPSSFNVELISTFLPSLLRQIVDRFKNIQNHSFYNLITSRMSGQNELGRFLKINIDNTMKIKTVITQFSVKYKK